MTVEMASLTAAKASSSQFFQIKLALYLPDWLRRNRKSQPILHKLLRAISSTIVEDNGVLSQDPAAGAADCGSCRAGR